MTLMRRDPFYRAAPPQGAAEQPAPADFVRPFSPYELAVDMYETGDAFVVTMSVPGVKPEDIEVTMTADSLTIKGELAAPEGAQEQHYVFRERHFGSFVRTMALPKARLDIDAARAEFHNGLLTLTLPKAEEVKARAVQVKVK